MGAAWIHGMNDKNPITQIQKKLRLATFATDYDNQVVYSYATGGEYSEDKIAEAWQEHEMVGRRNKWTFTPFSWSKIIRIVIYIKMLM